MVSWLVDDAEPNPIYFKQPTVADLYPYLAKANLSIYDGVPMITFSFAIRSYNSSSIDRIRSAIQQAWHEANPSISNAEEIMVVLDETSLFSNLQQQKNIATNLNDDKRVLSKRAAAILNAVRRDLKTTDNERLPDSVIKAEPSLSAFSLANITYFIGVADRSFDAGELRQPSIKMMNKALRNYVSNADVVVDMEEKVPTSAINPSSGVSFFYHSPRVNRIYIYHINLSIFPLSINFYRTTCQLFSAPYLACWLHAQSSQY